MEKMDYYGKYDRKMSKKGEKFVQKGSFVAPLWVTEKYCPFCYEKLGNAEYFKLKTRKRCKCPKCGKTVDRRYVVY